MYRAKTKPLLKRVFTRYTHTHHVLLSQVQRLNQLDGGAADPHLGTERHEESKGSSPRRAHCWITCYRRVFLWGYLSWSLFTRRTASLILPLFSFCQAQWNIILKREGGEHQMQARPCYRTLPFGSEGCGSARPVTYGKEGLFLQQHPTSQPFKSRPDDTTAHWSGWALRTDSSGVTGSQL